MGLNHKATDNMSKVSRKQGGLVLKTLRTTQGLTQRELAEKAGLEYYTFISQIEAGVGKVPPQKLNLFAAALGCDPIRFTREMMKFYDPDTFEVIFASDRQEPTNYEYLRTFVSKDKSEFFGG